MEVRRISGWNVEWEGDRKLWSQNLAEITVPDADTELDYTGITKKHWKSADSISCVCCANKACKKKFSLIDRPHHCRRCGDVFCNTCVKFQRKLNHLANPDPNGKSYKVCQKCFEVGRDNEGCMRRLTEEFRFLKAKSREDSAKLKYGQIAGLMSWRDRLNIDTECQRLVIGFQGSIGTSEMKCTLQEMKNMLSTPEWQKSTYWVQENMATTCRPCRAKFGLVKKKTNCKVCGMAVCKSCSSKDLLIYIPDDRDCDDPEPQLAVIRIIGCPESEPEISLYLRVCSPCRELLVNKQVSRIQNGEEQAVADDSMTRLVNLQAGFRKVQDKVDSQLSEYQKVVESLEDNTRVTDGGKSNMKILAKAQEDLSDYLSEYIMKVQQLKQLKPETDCRAKIFRNCLKSKCDYYLENICTYRGLKNALRESAPPEVLEYIQRTVDKNAIVSTQLYVRQLVYEMIHLCDKYKLTDDFPRILAPVDEIVESDTKACLIREGEDYEEHVSHLQQMIQTQMRGHRLIRASRRSLREFGAKHAADVLQRRAKDTLQQVKIQLLMKSANRSFSATKEALELAHRSAQTLQVKVIPNQ